MCKIIASNKQTYDNSTGGLISIPEQHFNTLYSSLAAPSAKNSFITIPKIYYKKIDYCCLGNIGRSSKLVSFPTMTITLFIVVVIDIVHLKITRNMYLYTQTIFEVLAAKSLL